jgi:hypothetical protein
MKVFVSLSHNNNQLFVELFQSEIVHFCVETMLNIVHFPEIEQLENLLKSLLKSNSTKNATKNLLLNSPIKNSPYKNSPYKNSPFKKDKNPFDFQGFKHDSHLFDIFLLCLVLLINLVEKNVEFSKMIRTFDWKLMKNLKLNEFYSASKSKSTIVWLTNMFLERKNEAEEGIFIGDTIMTNILGEKTLGKKREEKLKKEEEELKLLEQQPNNNNNNSFSSPSKNSIQIEKEIEETEILDQLHMTHGENKVIASYLALLLGLLIEMDHESRKIIIQLLPCKNLVSILETIEEFILFNFIEGMISKDTHQSFKSVLQSLHQLQETIEKDNEKK